jgi:hypothetical protein
MQQNEEFTTEDPALRELMSSIVRTIAELEIKKLDTAA